MDVIVSGDGDARIFFIEQVEPGVFKTHVIEDKKVGQSGVALGDLDRDGIDELVVSTFDGNSVSIYKMKQ